MQSCLDLGDAESPVASRNYRETSTVIDSESPVSWGASGGNRRCCQGLTLLSTGWRASKMTRFREMLRGFVYSKGIEGGPPSI